MTETRKSDFSDSLYLTKVCAFVAIAICSFISTPFSTVGTGIDLSYMYAINLDLNWGSEVVLTYGPLGYLLWTANVNHHLLIAGAFWLGLYAYALVLFGKIFFSEKSPLANNKVVIVTGAVLYCLSASLLDAEKFFCFVALLSILVAYKIDRRYNIGGSILLLLSFYIKGSLAVQIISAYVVFVLILWINQHKDKLVYTIELLISVILFPITFILFYSHSFTALGKYVRGILEMSSGYNAAMSSDWEDIYVVWIIVLIVCYFGMCVIMAVKQSKDLPLAMALLGPLFFAYKHGFVRADQYHILYSFPVLLAYVVPFLMCYDMNFLRTKDGEKSKCSGIYSGFVATILVICFIFVQGGKSDFFETIKFRTLDLPSRIQDMVEQDYETSLYVLPNDIRETISYSSVCIYPWELSYIASNDINYKIMPTFQAYNTYTPYLDKLCADFFAADDAPEYIIMSTQTIDDRWTLLENPQTWIAIRDHYEYVRRDGNLFLLRNRMRAEEKNYELAETTTVSKEDVITVDPYSDTVYKVDAELTLWGKLVNLFWKIPEVNMTVTYVDKGIVTKRVILDNFSGGVDLTHAFNDEGMLELYLNGTGPTNSAVTSVQFTGEGLQYYKDEMVIERYDKIAQ